MTQFIEHILNFQQNYDNLKAENTYINIYLNF
jgi:hypothetical protein